ncbi:MAG: hypothetical protein ACREV5_14310 [Steroidobacter sp.]
MLRPVGAIVQIALPIRTMFKIAPGDLVEPATLQVFILPVEVVGPAGFEPATKGFT